MAIFVLSSYEINVQLEQSYIHLILDNVSIYTSYSLFFPVMYNRYLSEYSRLCCQPDYLKITEYRHCYHRLHVITTHISHKYDGMRERIKSRAK